MFAFNIKIKILNNIPEKKKCCYTRDVYFKPNPGKKKSYHKPGVKVLNYWSRFSVKDPKFKLRVLNLKLV